MDALASLHKVCGEEHVRPGAAADAVDGVVPAYVAAPASTDDCLLYTSPSPRDRS